MQLRGKGLIRFSGGIAPVTDRTTHKENIGVRGMPERDIGSLGVMGLGLDAARRFFRRRRRRRRRRPP